MDININGVKLNEETTLKEMCKIVGKLGLCFKGRGDGSIILIKEEK